MPREVIDPVKGQARRRREPLGKHHTRDNAADQARPMGDGDGVNLAKAQLCGLKRAGDHLIKPLHMGARRDFWHNAAKSRMEPRLTFHDRGCDAAPTHHCRSGVIATAFDTKNCLRVAQLADPLRQDCPPGNIAGAGYQPERR